MFMLDKKLVVMVCLLFVVLSIGFIFIDWSVDGFDFFKAQKYEFFFQSWVSIAGVIFTVVMALTVFFIYKKTRLDSLKFIIYSLLLTSLAFAIIGYHTSYCKVCSDLTMCGASHNYPNYLIVAALIISAIISILVNLKNNITVLKVLASGLIAASSLLLIVLFFSIRFMETPDVISYVIESINLQGLVFILPVILILTTFIYFKKTYQISTTLSLVFLLLFISCLPQAYHIFICTECHSMECSEFYVFSGLIMLVSIGSLLYSMSLQLEEERE